jgi:hypothetical protein
MKQLILPIALLAISITTARAQDGRDNFHIGVKAGANLSNVYDESDNSFEADGKLGFAGGAFVSIPLGTWIGIQPEVMYSQKGYNADQDILGIRSEYSRTLSYIDVPLQVAIKPAPGLTILAGPQYSYLVSRTETFRHDNASGSTTEEIENQDIRENTLGFVAGLDINFLNFVVAPRVGFDLMSNHSDGSSDEPRYKNNWAQLTVGLRF